VGSDRSQLANVANGAKAVLQTDKLDAVADRGYFNGVEILACDRAGITVTLPKPMTSGAKLEILWEFGDGAEPNATVFVRHLRNRTGALSPRNRNGALRQFVSKAGSATPELAFLAGTAAGSPSGRPQPIAGVETAVLTPTKFYERRAKDCVQAAGRTDNPKHREQLLKLAYEWAQAAALRASLAIDAAEDGRPRSFT